MDTCHALFVLEGSTDVPVIRACLTKVYGAKEIGALKVLSPPWKDERQPVRRKYQLGDRIVGLFDPVPGGKDEAYAAHRLLVELACSGLYTNLRLVVLVRDLNGESHERLHSNFLGRMRSISLPQGIGFRVVQDNPAWVQFGELQATQVLMGDPGFGLPNQNAADDHILGFVKQQPQRDPTPLVKMIESQVGHTLSSKQQVLLSMVLEEYWGHPGGFYERVLDDVPEEQLRALAESLGLNEVIEALGAAV